MAPTCCYFIAGFCFTIAVLGSLGDGQPDDLQALIEDIAKRVEDKENEITRLEADVEAYETDVDELRETVRGYEATIATQEQHIATLKQDIATQQILQGKGHGKQLNKRSMRQIENSRPIAFLAALSNTAFHLNTSQSIAFDDAITNIGQNYDAQSGVFTAPVDGLYVFFTSLLSFNNTQTHFAFQCNGTVVSKMFYHGDRMAGFDTTGMTVTLELSKGDDISVSLVQRPTCKSNAHVCTSIMKYPDGTEFDEGPYCKCPGCSSKWQPDDFQSLSWPHYERADKTVQYKFCVPLIPKRECEPGDLAITVGTNTGEWTPHIKEARCSCPGNMYQLLGWWKHPTNKYDNKTGVWVYEYFCEKPDCDFTEHQPCAKIYIDKYSEDRKHMVIGYNFLCACPSGMKCPDRKDDDEDEDYETDFLGNYIPKYCELVHKGSRK